MKTRWRRDLRAALALALLFAGCSSSDEADRDASPAASCEKVLPTGLLFIAGKTSADASLYRAGDCLDSSPKLSGDRTVSLVTARGTTAIVSAVVDPIGDVLFTVGADGLVPFADDPPYRASAPELSATGDIAFVVPSPEVNDESSSLLVFQLPGRPSEASIRIRSDGALVCSGWGPNGSLAASYYYPSKREVPVSIELTAPGEPMRVLTPRIQGFYCIRWRESAPFIAASQSSPPADPSKPRTYLLESTTMGIAATIPGWRGLDWSPSGAELLVADHRGRLGVARGPRWTVDVIDTGKRGPIWSAAWP